FWLLAAVVAGSGSLMALPQVERTTFTRHDGQNPAALPAKLLPGETKTKNSSQESPAVLPQRRLLNVAESLCRRNDIPYALCGSAMADRATCQECRACVSVKHLRVDRRARSCQACRQCGVDCSHFVNRVFKEAGLPFPYLATAKMKRLPAEKLRAKYG